MFAALLSIHGSSCHPKVLARTSLRQLRFRFVRPFAPLMLTSPRMPSFHPSKLADRSRDRERGVSRTEQMDPVEEML